MLKTIIISDIHIGKPDAQPQKLLAFLEKNPCENLIINGDLIDDLFIKFFGAWKQKHVAVIEQIKAICKKNKTKIFYIQGNHEIKDRLITKDLKMQKHLIYTSDRKKYYICHGHQFDKVNYKHWGISYLAFFGGSLLGLINRIYNATRQKLGYKKQSLMTPIKRLAKSFIGGRKNIDKKIYETAIEKNCDGVICGHFHETENRQIGKIHYLNSGEWVETRSAIIENQKGERKIVFP
ncbi:MAG: UDP-2,3-diacylglucosamine diphosphatase [Candidatus Absconditabacterales bacterium]